MPNHYSGPDRRTDQTLTRSDLEYMFDKHEASERQHLTDAINQHLLSDQHLFVSTWMKKEQRKQELWEKTKAHVTGWGAVAVIIFVANLIWTDLVNLFHKGN